MSNKKIISDNYMDDKSDRTSIVKDRILPNVNSKIVGGTMGIGGAVVGAGLGLAGRKAIGGARRALMRQGATSQIGKMMGDGAAKLYSNGIDVSRLKKPAKVMFSPEYRKARQLLSAGAGAAYLAPKAKRTGEVISNTNSLKKQYRNQFGVDPSESELFEAAKLNPRKRTDRALSKMFYTPNSMTKSTFRNIRQMNRMPNVLNPNEQVMNGSNMVPVYGAGYSTPYMNNYSMLNSFSGQSQGLNKYSSEYDVDMIKVADYKNKINIESVKKVKESIGKANKVSPYVGGAAGALLTAPTANLLSSSFIAEDEPNAKLKKALINVGATGAGALAGGSIAKTSTSLANDLANKVTNPRTIADPIKKMKIWNQFRK